MTHKEYYAVELHKAAGVALNQRDFETYRTLIAKIETLLAQAESQRSSAFHTFSGKSAA
jgi:hypothetical protein